MDLTVIIIAWLVCGIAALLIAQNRGATNAVTWFLVGVLLGPIGVLLAIIGAKPPKGATPRDDAMRTLAGLAELRRQGNLSDGEYESKKADLLRRI
jgi:uncharacterized membrane protein YczE